MTAPSKLFCKSHFFQVRARTESLIETLSAEDLCLQSMTDASPGKWHLAHTTWFFEQFILLPFAKNYRVFDPSFSFLFNSYYQSIGPMHPRPDRGLLSRPSLDEVLAYRKFVDNVLSHLLAGPNPDPEISRRLELGCNHEQQHQELLLMDIKHAFFQSPLRPAFKPGTVAPAEPGSTDWINYEGGLTDLGHDGNGFGFDNEFPRHRVFLEPFALADRLVTNEQYLEFMEDGGYRDPSLWLMDGFDFAQTLNPQAPLYWYQEKGQWFHHTLYGCFPLDPNLPVAHISFFEADAFSRWAKKRLPTEAEWEFARNQWPTPEIGNSWDAPCLQPKSLGGQWQDSLWQWTSSSYSPYPGYQTQKGALGEYNGKFMVNQYVLRGGTCLIPETHLRSNYRNFYYPHQRWMFSGLRLAGAL